MQELWKPNDVELDVRPEDSVSNAGSRAGSKSHVTGMSKVSRRTSRARASAKKAILEAHSASLVKRQALQEEQHKSDQLLQEIDWQRHKQKNEHI